MIVNARMYAVSAEAGDAWRRLLLGVARKAGLTAQVFEHPAPAPMGDLWSRPDMAAVFMCGLPYSRSRRALKILAAPVPLPHRFAGEARYWSEFVVRADSKYDVLADTFGQRLALTVPESQSGYAAPLRHLMQWAGTQPVFEELIEPRISPIGAITAVIDGSADVAPVDSYSFRLMQRYRPDLTDRVRIVDSTVPRPIPAIVASTSEAEAMGLAFREIDKDLEFAPLLSELELSRFVIPDPGTYRTLRDEFFETADFWRNHPLAAQLHPTFAVEMSKSLGELT